MQRGKVRTFPPACKRWRVGGPKLLHTSQYSWLFQEQGGDLCCLQHVVGRVLCLSAALPGDRVLGSHQLRSNRRPSRFCSIFLLESSPQLGSDKEVSVPLCPSLLFLLPWAGFTEKNLVWGFTSFLSWWQMKRGRSNLGYTGAGFLVSTASIFSEHTGSLWFHTACVSSKAKVN